MRTVAVLETPAVADDVVVLGKLELNGSAGRSWSGLPRVKLVLCVEVDSIEVVCCATRVDIDDDTVDVRQVDTLPELDSCTLVDPTFTRDEPGVCEVICSSLSPDVDVGDVVVRDIG